MNKPSKATMIKLALGVMAVVFLPVLLIVLLAVAGSTRHGPAIIILVVADGVLVFYGTAPARRRAKTAELERYAAEQ